MSHKLKVGDKRKFSFGDYKITEILENCNTPFSLEVKKGKCPHCQKEIVDKVTHRFQNFFVMKGIGRDKGRSCVIGTTYPSGRGKPGLILRMPDKEMYPERAKEFKETLEKLRAKKGGA
jgi:hypothetical protein